MMTSGGPRELGHDCREVRDGQVVGCAGDDRYPGALGGARRRVRDRRRVVVIRRDDRHPQLGGRLGEPWRELGRGERRRVRAEVRAACADAKDEGKATAGQSVGHRARLPIHEAGVARRLAGRDRQRRCVGADDDGHTVRLEGRHDRWRIAARLQVANVENDPPSSIPPSALTKSAAAWTPASSSFAKPAAFPSSGKTAPIRRSPAAAGEDVDGGWAGEAQAVTPTSATAASSRSKRGRDERTDMTPPLSGVVRSGLSGWWRSSRATSAPAVASTI